MVFAQSPSKKKTRPSKGRDSLGDSRGATLIAQAKDLSLFKAITVPTDRPYAESSFRPAARRRVRSAFYAEISPSSTLYSNGRATTPLQSIVMLLNVITRADIIMYLDTVSICIETMMKVF